MKSRLRIHFPKQRGSVLIVVLWASIALVSVALMFGHSMLMNYRGVDNETAGRQADAAIEGAIRYAQTLLTESETPGALPELTSYEGEAVQLGEATFWFIGRSDDSADGTTREFALLDEASRINVNTADRATLMGLPRMTDDIEAAIDEYRTPISGGVATTDVKGAPLESVDELALVPGMTKLILYGEDTNGNGVLDANEDDGSASPPEDNADGKLDPGLTEYLTVFTKESDKQDDNTSPRLDVGQLGSGGAMDEVRTMIKRVLGENSTSPNLAQRPYASVLDFLAGSGIQPALSEDDCDKIAPNLVASDPGNPGQPLVTGLVNVNTASEAVLTALLDADTAANLIAARAMRTLPSTGLTWAAAQIPPQYLATTARFLTGQSSQVSVDVAAVGRHGRGYRRTRVVFDISGLREGKIPKVIYRRDLAPLGWALGRDARDQLALKKGVR